MAGRIAGSLPRVGATIRLCRNSLVCQPKSGIHNMRPGTTSRSTGSKLPSGTRTVQVNTTQPELQGRLWHVAMRGTNFHGQGSQRTEDGR